MRFLASNSRLYETNLWNLDAWLHTSSSARGAISVRHLVTHLKSYFAVTSATLDLSHPPPRLYGAVKAPDAFPHTPSPPPSSAVLLSRRRSGFSIFSGSFTVGWCWTTVAGSRVGNLIYTFRQINKMLWCQSDNVELSRTTGTSYQDKPSVLYSEKPGDTAAILEQ